MLAISGDTRSKLLPEVPTFAEAGLKDFSVTNWIGLWAPRGTPQPILDRLGKEISAIMATPEMKTFAEEAGAAPKWVVGEDFVRLVKEEDARWKGVIDKIGLQKK
jgi:tripartite-type tricarboxylate transporter receptor subunit TctC